MNEMVESRKVFSRLKKVVLANRKNGEMSKSSDIISVAFSDLIYSITSERVETITFTVLDLQLVLNPDDSLLLMEIESDHLEFYEVESIPMIRKIHQHLIWRMEILHEFGI